MKKSIILIITLLLASVILVGCNTDLYSGSDDINVWMMTTPDTLDPAMASSFDSTTYDVHMFQGLFRYKWDGTGIEPGDAESYTVSDDGLDWTFKLRSDIKWSDGKEVTAFDYEYSWKRVCDPELASPNGADMAAFFANGPEVFAGEIPPDELGVKAVDDRTLVVRLAGPCPFFDQVAVFRSLYPVRRDIVEEYGDSWWIKSRTLISNGPFKLKNFSLDEEIVMEPNEFYYDRAKVVPEILTFRLLADENSALAAIRGGWLDFSHNAPPEEIPALIEDGLFDRRELLGTYYVCFNNDHPPFDDPLVRKALTLAIDREYICEAVMEGTYVPATAMVGFGFQDDEPQKDFRETGGDYISADYEANKKLAREALAEAGYPDGVGFPLVEYMYNSSPMHKSVAEVLQASWGEVLGIKVNLTVQEFGSFINSRRQGNYEVARNGWLPDWNDPSSMLAIFQSDGGNNDSNYYNPEFDQYLAESLASNDKTVRMSALHNAEKVLMDDWGTAPVMYYANNFVVVPELKGWSYNPLGLAMFHTAYKE